MTAPPKSPQETRYNRQWRGWTGPLTKGKGTAVTALRRSQPRTSRAPAQRAERVKVKLISLLMGRTTTGTVSLTSPPLASRRPPQTRKGRTETRRRRKSREVVAALPKPGTIRPRRP